MPKRKESNADEALLNLGSSCKLKNIINDALRELPHVLLLLRVPELLLDALRVS